MATTKVKKQASKVQTQPDDGAQAGADEPPGGSSTTNKKKLIGVTSDKGGNGKSTVARVIAHLALQKSIRIMAFDCDKRNPQLHRFYNQALSSSNGGAGVMQLDMSTPRGGIELFSRLEKDAPDIMLIDFPAGGGELFERFDQQTYLLKTLDTLGYELTMVSVLNRGKDSVNSLRSLVDYCGEKANHVVVKNGFFGTPEVFSRYDNSKTKVLVESKGGITIAFPDLEYVLYDYLDDKSMTFSDVLRADNELSFGERHIAHIFLEKAEEALMKADHLLGLG